MATVVLVRHGRTTANSAQILAGRSPGVHLDDLGRTQAARVADRLAGIGLREVVSSPLVRCRETAAAVLERQQGTATAQRESGIVEVDYGDWTGRALKDLAKEPLWRTVQAHPAAVTFPGGESMAAMAARAVGAVRRWDRALETEHGTDTVWVAVSHGDVIKAVIADALGIHLDLFQRIVVDPASATVIRYTPERPFVLMTNSHEGDLSHLAAKPPAKGRRRARASKTTDAAVGGGAGPERG